MPHLFGHKHAHGSQAGQHIIEVFADICCPFTHVGLRRLVEERAKRGRPDVHLRVRSWPLEVVNGKPLDPSTVLAEVDALKASVAPELFGGFSIQSFPASSLPAMDVAATAYGVSLDVGETVSLAIREALFEKGCNVIEPAVLAEIADAHGLPAPGTSPDNTAALDDYDEGMRRGVVGSPHFFVGDADFFCPALDISHDALGFKVAFDVPRFQAFLDACFS